MQTNAISRPPKRLGTVGAHRTNQKSKAWLLTFNFPPGTKPDQLTADDKLNIRAFNRAAQVHPVTYCVFQGEVGEQGTYHIQAYAEFAQPVTMPAIKRHFGLNSLHCEIRLGTQQQAIDYCTKEQTRASDIHEYGVPSHQKSATKQGGRGDLEHIWGCLKQGKPIADIIDEQPSSLRHISMMQKAQFEALRSLKRKHKTVFHVFYGAAGTGKTTTAINFATVQNKSYFLVPNDGKALWWNGYDPMTHEIVILDEFNGSKLPLTFLNQLADSVDLRVQTKGGFLPFVAKHLIVTTNFHPKQWYDFENREKNLCWDALERRIDNLIQFRLDIHIPLPEQGGETRLHIEIEKGGLNKRWIKSPYPLDCPPTAPVSPEIPSSPELVSSSPPKTQEPRERLIIRRRLNQERERQVKRRRIKESSEDADSVYSSPILGDDQDIQVPVRGLMDLDASSDQDECPSHDSDQYSDSD